MASSYKKKIKSDIISSIEKENPNIPKHTIITIVDSFLLCTKDALITKHNIELRGFGTLEIRTRKPKTNARNPKTGKSVQVSSHDVVSFRAGKELKSAVWDIKPTD